MGCKGGVGGRKKNTCRQLTNGVVASINIESCFRVYSCLLFRIDLSVSGLRPFKLERAILAFFLKAVELIYPLTAALAPSF